SRIFFPRSVPEWWNWQTRTFEGRVEKSMRVRVPPPAPRLRRGAVPDTRLTLLPFQAERRQGRNRRLVEAAADADIQPIAALADPPGARSSPASPPARPRSPSWPSRSET